MDLTTTLQEKITAEMVSAMLRTVADTIETSGTIKDSALASLVERLIHEGYIVSNVTIERNIAKV